MIAASSAPLSAGRTRRAVACGGAGGRRARGCGAGRGEGGELRRDGIEAAQEQAPRAGVRGAQPPGQCTDPGGVERLRTRLEQALCLKEQARFAAGAAAVIFIW